MREKTYHLCFIGGRQCYHSGSGSVFACKGYDTACADHFKSKEVYQSGY